MAGVWRHTCSISAVSMVRETNGEVIYRSLKNACAFFVLWYLQSSFMATLRFDYIG
jgi:hypothetical protein